MDGNSPAPAMFAENAIPAWEMRTPLMFLRQNRSGRLVFSCAPFGGNGSAKPAGRVFTQAGVAGARDAPVDAGEAHADFAALPRRSPFCAGLLSRI